MKRMCRAIVVYEAGAGCGGIDISGYSQSKLAAIGRKLKERTRKILVYGALAIDSCIDRLNSPSIAPVLRAQKPS